MDIINYYVIVKMSYYYTPSFFANVPPTTAYVSGSGLLLSGPIGVAPPTITPHAALLLLNAQSTQAQTSSSSYVSMSSSSSHYVPEPTKTEVKKEKVTITPDGKRIVETIIETYYNNNVPSSSQSQKPPCYAAQLGLQQYQPIERPSSHSSNNYECAKPIRMDGGFPVFP